MSEPKDDLRTILSKSFDEAEWGWLKPHIERDAVIVVSRELSLLEASVCIAQNETPKVDGWISQGLLAKPTLEQIEAWNREPQKPFMSVVVQPFVLIQEVMSH